MSFAHLTSFLVATPRSILVCCFPVYFCFQISAKAQTTWPGGLRDCPGPGCPSIVYEKEKDKPRQINKSRQKSFFDAQLSFKACLSLRAQIENFEYVWGQSYTELHQYYRQYCGFKH